MDSPTLHTCKRSADLDHRRLNDQEKIPMADGYIIDLSWDDDPELTNRSGTANGDIDVVKDDKPDAASIGMQRLTSNAGTTSGPSTARSAPLLGATVTTEAKEQVE